MGASKRIDMGETNMNNCREKKVVAACRDLGY